MTYSISKGMLYKEGALGRQVPSPNHSGAYRVNPTKLVMHYTAGGSGYGSAAWLANPNAGASAHFVICREGTVIQCVSVDRRAWHAGKSQWGELTNLNSYSIGIELANWGPLRDDGTTAAGKAVDYIEAAHKNGGRVRKWEVYPPAQIVAAEAVARAIAAYHPIDEIVGHDDIAPARKLDPGPAFDMTAFRKAVLGQVRGNAAPERGTVTASSLNVRSGPGTTYPVVSGLSRGQSVPILERRREWISIAPGQWVFGEYVR
ncbi:N-acetylmuramoyl-L-alanine amidase [Novosphingobium decolorationis]|uniref:N-acetylmuramoyl-L-alanine amidase n=1 Tax=Novosphingobium decolorationis TaxID=2698673 RepID=A0ABX8E1B1_9SPHN|nr:N-acetylmuramoyl-L-alanine amidase [Novosphingobium decolorationis]QVM82927.1 N-acetylmuramoyl-L-alanine amidase [Novosphingobium decolorationis]